MFGQNIPLKNLCKFMYALELMPMKANQDYTLCLKNAVIVKVTY